MVGHILYPHKQIIKQTSEIHLNGDLGVAFLPTYLCVWQKKEAAEINGNPEKEGKAMLAMHHYLKESDREGIEFDKNQFCTQSRLCMSTDMM